MGARDDEYDYLFKGNYYFKFVFNILILIMIFFNVFAALNLVELLNFAGGGGDIFGATKLFVPTPRPSLCIPSDGSNTIHLNTLVNHIKKNFPGTESINVFLLHGRFMLIP